MKGALRRMWSLWIFTVPSLRARDCSKPEKDALNLLFLGIPLLNVLVRISDHPSLCRVMIVLSWCLSHVL